MLRLSCFLLFVFIWSAAAHAAAWVSCANGNWDGASTWCQVEPGTFQDTEGGATNLTTSLTGTNSTLAAASAATIKAAGVKLASVVQTGTSLTCEVFDVTASAAVAGTSSMITESAILNGGTASSASQGGPEGGWMIWTFSSQTLTSGHDYSVKCSVASATSNPIALWATSAAATTYAQLLVTTTTGAPAAADQEIIAGSFAGGTTAASVIVTDEGNLSGTTYGSNSNVVASPSIALGQYGTFCIGSTGTCGPASATNYSFKYAGPFVVYNGGTLSQGTNAAAVPMSSSCTESSPCAVLTMAVSTEGDTGLVCRNGSNCLSNGAPRTAATCATGMSCIQTHLVQNYSSGAIPTTNCPGGVACLQVADATGWQVGDVIVVASTDSNNGTSHSEKFTLTANATATALPVAGDSFSFGHLGQIVSYTSVNNNVSYTMPEQAEVILLTRNVRIQGASNTQPGYIYCAPTANCGFAWTDFKWIGGTTSEQYGIDSDTIPGGSFNLTYFSYHDGHDGGLVLADTQATWGGTVSSPVTIQYGVLYNVNQNVHSFPANSALVTNQFGINPNWILDNITIMDVPDNGIFLRAISGRVTNIVMADITGSGGAGLATQSPTTGSGFYLGIWGPLTFHSNAGFDFNWSANGIVGTINGCYAYHSYGPFLLGTHNRLICASAYGLGNSVFQAGGKGANDETLTNGFLANDAISGARPPFGIDEGFNIVEFDNEELCPTQTVTITQNGVANPGQSLFVSCGTGSATSVTPVNDVGALASGPNILKIIGRNSPFLSPADLAQPGLLGDFLMSPDSFVCTEWIANHECFMTYGRTNYDTTIAGPASSFSERMTPKIVRFTGTIAGTALTVSGSPAPYPALSVTANLQLTAPSLLAGTLVNGGTGSGGAGSYTVNNSQSFGPAVITGPLGRLQSAPIYQGFKVAVPSGQTRQVCVSVRESASTDANGINYNGDAPRLIDRMNPQMGVQSDTVAATFTSGQFGVWQQQCAQTPVASQDGVFEYVVDADMTATSNAGGWINVANWSATN